MLRVADDLKDHETDKILFPDRPLASGKTEIKDFDKCIEEIYYMIMDLYSDFPAFKKLNKELIHYSLFFCIKIYDKIYNR